MSRYFSCLCEFRGISQIYLNFAAPRPREISEALAFACKLCVQMFIKLVHCTCKLYTKDNAKVRLTKSMLHKRQFENTCLIPLSKVVIQPLINTARKWS